MTASVPFGAIVLLGFARFPEHPLCKLYCELVFLKIALSQKIRQKHIENHLEQSPILVNLQG